MKRREFLKAAGLAGAGLAATGAGLSSCTGMGSGNAPKPYHINTAGGARMKLSWEPYELQLRHVFTVASYSRTTTPDVQVKIEYDGFTGYGEASMPPYLGQTVQSVCSFLEKVDLGQFADPFCIDDILTYVDSLSPGDTAAKAAVDIALHDLVGQLLGQPWYRIWGLDAAKAPDTTFTIGIDTADVVREKTRECASQFNILKVKVGLENDMEMIRAIRDVTMLPLAVDANQGWKDREKALEEIFWLKEQGIVMVEQPMPKERIDDNAWLTERSPLPIFADEAIQRERHPVHQGSLYRYQHQTDEVHRHARSLENGQLCPRRRHAGDGRLHDRDFLRRNGRRPALPHRGLCRPGRQPAHFQRPFPRYGSGERQDYAPGPPGSRTHQTVKPYDSRI